MTSWIWLEMLLSIPVSIPVSLLWLGPPWERPLGLWFYFVGAVWSTIASVAIVATVAVFAVRALRRWNSDSSAATPPAKTGGE